METKQYSAPSQVEKWLVYTIMVHMSSTIFFRCDILVWFATDHYVGRFTCHVPVLGSGVPLQLQTAQTLRANALRPHHQCHTGRGRPNTSCTSSPAD